MDFITNNFIKVLYEFYLKLTFKFVVLDHPPNILKLMPNKIQWLYSIYISIVIVFLIVLLLKWALQIFIISLACTPAFYHLFAVCSAMCIIQFSSICINRSWITGILLCIINWGEQIACKFFIDYILNWEVNVKGFYLFLCWIALRTLSHLVKVILCASKHICSIVRYCFRSFKQL